MAREIISWDARTPEIVRAILRSYVHRIEHNARERRTPAAHIDDIASAMSTHRAGLAIADGGAVSVWYPRRPLTSQLEVAWWRHLDQVHLYISASRVTARRLESGRSASCQIRPGPSRLVLFMAYPERYRQVRQVLDKRVRRKLERRGLLAPPHPWQLSQIVLDRPAGVIVADDLLYAAFLCTNAGYLRLHGGPPSSAPRPAWLAKASGLPTMVCRRYIAGKLSADELAAEVAITALAIDSHGLSL